MNAIPSERFLHVTEVESSGPDLVALLGRDIRAAEEVIAKYCITRHWPVFEDLAVLVESMAFMDRAITRHRSKGWSRELVIRLPVYELEVFMRAKVVDALTNAAWFLTGDRWSFDFVRRNRPVGTRQSPLPWRQSSTVHVIPFSDGLDSFAQAQLSVREHGKDSVLLVRAGLGKAGMFPDLMSLRVPRRFGGIRLREVSYRTRPLIFYSFAAIAACMTNADSVVIGENGQGAFGPACLPFADEWWFRSAHPAFVSRWANVLGLILDMPIRFEQPNLWKTKGEVLAELFDKNLSAGWQETSSCSSRPAERYGRSACGICGGCLLRIVSALGAGLEAPADQFAFDVRGCGDRVRDHRHGKLKDMTQGHREVAVRAIAAMEGFARLPDSSQGIATINREARLVDPNNCEQAEKSLVGLLQRHRVEWNSFMRSLPIDSWLREIVEQL